MFRLVPVYETSPAKRFILILCRTDFPIDKQLRKTDKRTRPYTDGPFMNQASAV
ncbi:hypothetical protein D2M30_0963 [Bacillus amyloliquefaciens]|nr:hypothetical protein D2M30_0963 [Bacillus amyloliquefaciens]